MYKASGIWNWIEKVQQINTMLARDYTKKKEYHIGWSRNHAIKFTNKNMFFNKYKYTAGALEDKRTEIEQEKDYLFEEMVSSPDLVNWTEKTKDEWRSFPIFSQDGSGSCVAQTMRKMLGIMHWLKDGVFIDFSASHIYQRRINKTKGGMGSNDVFKIAQQGTTLNLLAPSDDMTDDEMDIVKVQDYQEKIGEVFKIGNYVTIPSDIETIASVIQKTGKGVMVWFYFKHSEWTDVPFIKYPTLQRSLSTTSRHSVTAVDFTLYKGKRALIIEDSWGKKYGLGGRRIITEDFFDERNYYAAYPINFKFEEGDETSTFKFTKTLEFGQRNSDIVELQDVLKGKGFFPTNIQSTGYYGSITAKAVLAFQLAFYVDDPMVLNDLAGRIVGPKTIATLNDIN
jgi:hypothetical protein